MNKITCMILALALASLACLQSALQIEPSETPAPATVPAVALSATQEPEIESGAVLELASPEMTRANTATCGTITVVKVVNLREAPTEHSRVLTWLPAFAQVEVIERGEWWKVKAGPFTGYVKSNFIQECEQ